MGLNNLDDSRDGMDQFLKRNPDSWDIYLYYPEKQAEIQMLVNDDVAVDYSENVLTVYVTFDDEEAASAEEDVEWLLHFTAPLRGAWPSEIRLYWNGSEIPCENEKLKV